ncbi:MAG: hypothetical protein Q8L55_16045 [Phycisphaerales bacterium]|nr:hypothetical protein [Phycisphaerales bacterium]
MEQIEPAAVNAPPVVAGPLGVQRAAWPTVVGVISVVLGSLGILKNACGGVSSFAQGFGGMNLGPPALGGQYSLWMVITGVLSLVSLAVSGWLLWAGVQLLKRRKKSVALHRGWAWTRIGVALLEAAAGAAAQSAVMSGAMAAGGGAGGAGGGGAPAGMDAMLIAVAIVTIALPLIIALTYPVVVLALLSRPWAKLEVERWSGLRTCPACGYDTRGLPLGALCPECGAARNRCGSCGCDLSGQLPSAPCPECRALRA